MVDGDSPGHNVLEIGEIKVEPFVDTTRSSTIACVRLVRLLAELAVSCDIRSHFESDLWYCFADCSEEDGELLMLKEEESKVSRQVLPVIYTDECCDCLHFVLNRCVKHQPFRPSLRRIAPSAEVITSVEAAGCFKTVQSEWRCPL